MRAPRALLVAGLTFGTAFSMVVPGCGSDGGNGPGEALIASWDASSFTAQGNDFIADGMSLIMTFASGGTYTLDVTNDLVDICDTGPGTDCIVTGSFSSSGGQLTVDPGTVDEVVFDFTIQGTTLTLTGDIGGTPATIVLTRL